MENGTLLQTINGSNVITYSEDGSFFLKWWASIEYNRSDFYAGCSTNTTIRTPLISLNLKDIVGNCGALFLLSPVVRGTDVKLGYFPSDYFIRLQTKTRRTWKKNIHDIQLQEGSCEEEMVSEYLYILTLFNFEERDEGTYTLSCSQGGNTESMQLHIQEPPSYPVIGPKSADFNTTGCIYVDQGSDLYCKTENGTEPVQVELLFGHDLFIFAESKWNKGVYRFQNISQQMDGLSRRNVTCLVSNAATVTPYEVHGILCNVENGSQPILTVPEFLFGESSSPICEVRNAVPAPAIELRIGEILLANVQQIDIFNGSSHTFTSTATTTKTNKLWNGKDMCCTRKSKYDFGIKNVAVCKTINMKFPPTGISMSVNKTHDYNNNISACFLHVSCQTNESNPPCTIEWSSDNNNLRYIQRNNWSNGDSEGYRSFSNVLYKMTKNMAGGTITCSTRCDHFSSHFNINESLSFKGDPTLHLNTKSPINLYPNTTVTVKCFVDDCNVKGQWTFRWETENKTEIKTCKKTEECLLTLNYTGDEVMTYICSAWKLEELLRNSLTVLNSLTEGCPTLYLNATSPVDLHPKMKLIVKCFVDDCHVTGQWTFRWEDENKTEITSCKQTKECLFTLNYTGDEEMIYICIAWKSDELLSLSLTVLNTITEDNIKVQEINMTTAITVLNVTTNPAQDVTQQWYTPVIYAVSGTIVGLTLATLTGLLCWRCKHHVYETLLRRRRTAGRDLI
ncbi:uncharacterized protein LOC128234515 [Mya arenaria]|uniref:uncharacterized protein LOC128234515 n=1 Tax=Mya arenaria TaxID=6604 RepID=UPI0022E4B489|nr:uncharacterized protein LOC128234515 [Mya arenaria]